MAVQLNVNSYVSIADANAYFADRLDVAAWTSADDTLKGQALITATGLLDDMSWAGIAVMADQPLAFPRVSEYFDPKAGSMVYLDGSSIPGRIKKATMELAYHLLNNDGLLDSTGNIGSISVGSIKLDNMRQTEMIPLHVKTIIKPLLINAGSNTWWRAN